VYVYVCVFCVLVVFVVGFVTRARQHHCADSPSFVSGMGEIFLGLSVGRDAIPMRPLRS